MADVREDRHSTVLRAAAAPDFAVDPPELAAVEMFATLPQPALEDLARPARTFRHPPAARPRGSAPAAPSLPLPRGLQALRRGRPRRLPARPPLGRRHRRAA